MADWFELLLAEVKANERSPENPNGKGIKAVAAKLGYSRTAISLVLAGKYPGSASKVAQRVVEILGTVYCPSQGEVIAYRSCELMRLREAPTHNPQLMRHWRCCQTCTNNPSARPTEVSNKNRIFMKELTA